MTENTNVLFQKKYFEFVLDFTMNFNVEIDGFDDSYDTDVNLHEDAVLNQIEIETRKIDICECFSGNLNINVLTSFLYKF